MEKIISLLEEIKNFYKENAPAHIKFGAYLKAAEEQIVELESVIGKKYQIIMMEIQDGQGPCIYRDYENFLHYLEKHLQYLQEGKFYIEKFGDGSEMICVDSYI